jgi:hypothetical protein
MKDNYDFSNGLRGKFFNPNAFVTVGKLKGITEDFWNSFSEDGRLYWKIFSRCVALFATVLISKTGVASLDWALAFWAAFGSMLVIESQRSYSRYSPKLRKRVVRAVVVLGTWSVALLGVAVFLQASVVAVGQVFLSEISPLLSVAKSKVFIAAICVASAIAVYRALKDVFQRLEIKRLIFDMPNQGLRWLLVKRPWKAVALPFFIYFEFVTLVVCYLFVSTFADVLKIFIDQVLPLFK